MRIEIDIPEWAAERRLIVLAGIELVAFKEPWGPWKIKRVRCDQCGQCCMTFKPNSRQTPYGVDDEGKCNELKKNGDKWECGAGIMKPYACLMDPIDEPECCIVKE